MCVIRLWECVLDGGLLGTSLKWLNKNIAFVMQLYIAVSVKGGFKCFMPMLCLAKINLELISRPKSITKWGRECLYLDNVIDCISVSCSCQERIRKIPRMGGTRQTQQRALRIIGYVLCYMIPWLALSYIIFKMTEVRKLYFVIWSHGWRYLISYSRWLRYEAFTVLEFVLWFRGWRYLISYSKWLRYAAFAFVRFDCISSTYPCQ